MNKYLEFLEAMSSGAKKMFLDGAALSASGFAKEDKDPLVIAAGVERQKCALEILELINDLVQKDTKGETES